ncbi:MAG: saccharopine dehydrogenase family protein [Gammaproteobacteria bacterium]
MHIALVGAGAMGAHVANELCRREPDLALAVIDTDRARAEALAAGLKQASTTVHVCDARDIPSLTQALTGAAVTVNAAQYDANVDVMRACLAARTHYVDLGGMFHMTRRQLELGDAFAEIGRAAVLGMGAAPGLSNLVAAEACGDFDQVEGVRIAFAVAAPDMPPSPVFVPPYSIRTIMQEFCEPSVQFLAGELREMPALAGRRRIRFPEPIGEVDCVHTLHSEPATLPAYLRAKGIREVTWRLGLPRQLEAIIGALASAGLGATTPVPCGGATIAPVDFLAASIEAQIRRTPRSNEPYTEHACVQAEAWGVANGVTAEVTVDLLFSASGAPPDLAGFITGTPAAIAAWLLASNRTRSAGAFGPESLFAPRQMMALLAERGFRATRRASHALA